MIVCMSVSLSVTNRSVAAGSCLPCRMTLLLSIVLPSYSTPPPNLHSHISTYPLFYSAQELHFSPFKSRASTYLEASPEGDATISTREGLNMLLYSAINNPILCSEFSLDILCQSCFHFRSSQPCIFGLI